MVTGLVLKAAAYGLLLAQYDGGDSAGGGGMGALGFVFMAVASLVSLVVLLVMVATGWKIFVKAGQPGWASLVPVYNIIVLLNIIGKPMWWLALFFCCGPVGGIMASLELAKCFGKEMGFAIGMILLPIVFYPLLAFSDATYTPPPPSQA